MFLVCEAGMMLDDREGFITAGTTIGNAVAEYIEECGAPPNGKFDVYEFPDQPKGTYQLTYEIKELDPPEVVG